ncbi:MAG TPA: hypothetical protein VI997_03885 [Candidatus Thermoplasmatota archaeon]|nr:hypothetical protein [Candidatus Thermoplasmatota archaeon]
MPSGLVAPPDHPRAIPRRPVLRVDRRCAACGSTAEYGAEDAVLATAV